LIATVTSQSNRCPFCMTSHSFAAAELLGDLDLVQAVLADTPTAPLSNAERALIAFVEKVNRDANAITQEDVDEAKAAGWSDEALYDAITVCALFQFYNHWVGASGVPVMPLEDQKMSGRRLAQDGYAPDDDA